VRSDGPSSATVPATASPPQPVSLKKEFPCGIKLLYDDENAAVEWVYLATTPSCIHIGCFTRRLQAGRFG